MDPQVLPDFGHRGYVILDTGSLDATRRLAASLGPVIQVTHVAPRVNAKAALATDREMEFHTDHPRAVMIAWHCVRQCTEGGETLLKDAHQALAVLDEQTKGMLGKVTMGSHQVFKGDLGRYPVLRDELGISNRVYYTPWFRGEGSEPALDAFVSALESVETVSVRLKPGQMLLINNSRMLHGRSAIGGDKDRLLVRHWIAHTNDIFDRETGC